MRYVVRIKNKLDNHQMIMLTRSVADIIYESKYIDVIGVEAESVEQLEKLSFVDSVRESRVGEFQNGEFLTTIIFEPHVKKSALVNNGLVGWGDTRIAIIDSGINPKDITVTDMIDFSGTGMFDVCNHGNIVTKIVRHFAKAAQLYCAKVGAYNPDEINVMKAIEWAVDRGANLINISAGFLRERKYGDKTISCNNGNCEMCELVNTVISETGVAIVVAAGNRDNKENSIDCPGNAMNAVTVGAVDKDMKIADYSSIGAPGGIKPNIVAPGNGYIDGKMFNGTSFSAPLVTGVLGAILNKSGNIAKAIEYLYNTADDLDLPRHYQGHGCINIERLVGEVTKNETLNCDSSRQNQNS